ncbi:AGAP010682-PA-like protein [Anopheles sinensis]|uniref:Gamma-glutamylcyclotransferase family protein n=1 Tax=Anopheles sinensis TaxID=74873 RepID=A0A084WUF9_ANOSI|nr:AGAP010682-PA-like protein [Anopheles sinensis]
MATTIRRVFVYGTLKRGEPNHHWLTNVANGRAQFLAPGSTTIRYPLVVGSRYNIPFLLDVPGTGHFINGEIYEIDEPMLDRLDVLEDYPRLYERRTEAIRNTDDGSVVNCWIYLLQKFPKRLLAKPMLTEYRNDPARPYTEGGDDDVFDGDDSDGGEEGGKP